MKTRVAINGFGRIGRLVLRALVEQKRDDIEVVLLNSPGATEIMAHLLEFDSTHGKFASPITFDEDWMDVGTGRISVTHERDPALLPHGALDVDVVLECSGHFNSREKSSAHLSAGAKKVLVSAPASGADFTVVYGVNHELMRKDHMIVSNASCTTNCLAPMAKVMNDSFGLISGNMTTIHAYTGDQNILDNSHKDLRRARACGMSLIPTTTGSATAITHIFPELKGKLNGHAVRVPLANASITDCVFEVTKPTTAEQINQWMQEAAEGKLKGILGYEEKPLVSIDYKTDPRSSIVDALSTMVVNETQVKLYVWYDNEWGYANRTAELARKVARSLKG